MNLLEAREALSAALCASLPGYTVRVAPTATPKPKDGWVTVTRLEPEGFGDTYRATFTVAIILSSSLEDAEKQLDSIASTAFAAVGSIGTPLSLEPGQMSNMLFGIFITLIMEVGI